MHIRFVRDIIAFGKPRFAGEVIDVPPCLPDTAVCLRSGWAVVEDQAAAVNVQTISETTRVLKRKGRRK